MVAQNANKVGERVKVARLLMNGDSPTQIIKGGVDLSFNEVYSGARWMVAFAEVEAQKQDAPDTDESGRGDKGNASVPEREGC